MFIGQYAHNLDEKNRIIIPAKFRGKLNENAIITLGYDKCLTIYTEEGWEKLQTKLLEMSDNKSIHRQHVRIVAGSASECQCDSHGRILLPQNLIQAADIKHEIVIVGSLDHIEVWAKEAWDIYYDKAKEDFDTVAESFD